MGVPAKVDLTLERKEGISPGSGSSVKGLGKVVSAATGEGFPEPAWVEGGLSEAVSRCKLGAADILTPG